MPAQQTAAQPSLAGMPYAFDAGRQRLLESRPLEALLWFNHAYQQGDTSRRLRLLLTEALRSVEALQQVLPSSCQQLLDVAFSAQDQGVVAVCGDGRLLSWNRQGAPLGTRRIPGGPFRAALLNPDALSVQLIDQQGTITRYDGHLGRARAMRQRNGGPLTCAAFRPDGGQVLTGHASGALSIWDGRTGREVVSLKQKGSLPAQTPCEAWFSPDGRYAVVARRDGSRSLWDAVSGDPLPMRASAQHDSIEILPWYRASEQDLSTSTKSVLGRAWGGSLRDPAAVFSPVPLFVGRGVHSENNQLVATARSPGLIELWMYGSGARLGLVAGHTGEVTALRFSSDNSSLVSASQDGTVRIWRVDPGARWATLAGHSGPIVSAAFHPDDTQALTASTDGAVYVWSTGSGQVQGVLGTAAPTERMLSARWNATGTEVLVFDGGTLAMRPGMAGSLGWGSEGLLLPGLRGLSAWTLQRWDARGGSLLYRGVAHWPAGGSVATSADGQRAILIAAQQPLGEWTKRWAAKTRAFGFRGGRYVLVEGAHSQHELWDADTHRLVASLPQNPRQVFSAEISPDGRWLYTADDGGLLCIWDLREQRCMTQVSVGGVVFAVKFVPELGLMATASADSPLSHRGWIHLWDPLTAARIASWETDGAPLALASDNQGRRLLTGHLNGVAQLWSLDLETRSPEVVDMIVRCRVPYRLAGETVVPDATPPPGCNQLTHQSARDTLNTLSAQKTMSAVEAAALRSLRAADDFGVGHVGVSGAPVPAWYGMQTLLRRPALARPLFKQLLADSRVEPAGKLYALCGLRALDDPETSRYAATLAHDQHALQFRPGGCRGMDTTVAELASVIVNPAADHAMYQWGWSKESALELCRISP